MKIPFALSIALNCVLLAAFMALAMRYRLVEKAERVLFGEGRVPLVEPAYELNRDYGVYREIFSRYQDKDRPVLILGDSHTAKLDWNAFLGRGDIAARGIEGDTSEGLLHRLRDVDMDSTRTVVIWIGSNDILAGASAEKLVANIEGIAGVVARDGVSDIRVCAVMPLASWIEGAEASNTRIADTNVRLEKLCRANNLRFVDIAKGVADPKGYMSQDHTSDGLHLSASGYQAVTTSIFAAEASE